jgi:hypothetical protein
MGRRSERGRLGDWETGRHNDLAKKSIEYVVTMLRLKV